MRTHMQFQYSSSPIRPRGRPTWEMAVLCLSNRPDGRPNCTWSLEHASASQCFTARLSGDCPYVIVVLLLADFGRVTDRLALLFLMRAPDQFSAVNGANGRSARRTTKTCAGAGFRVFRDVSTTRPIRAARVICYVGRRPHVPITKRSAAYAGWSD